MKPSCAPGPSSRISGKRCGPSQNEQRAERLRKRQKEYKRSNGHCRVPQSHGTLGRWASNQRHRKGSLAQKYVGRPEKLGFEWNPGKLNQREPRKRKANFVSDEEHAVSDTEPRADEGAPARAANNGEDLPPRYSRTSHVAHGPSKPWLRSSGRS